MSPLVLFGQADIVVRTVIVGVLLASIWTLAIGDQIAFTRIGGGRFRIGVMSPSGQGEKLLTESWQDEGPSWAPNGRVVLFHRTAQGSGKADLWSVDLTGVNERKIPTPQDGSDPSWSPLLK